jgi:hypothetical protein
MKRSDFHRQSAHFNQFTLPGVAWPRSPVAKHSWREQLSGIFPPFLRSLRHPSTREHMSKYGLVEAEEIPAAEDASRQKFRRGSGLWELLQQRLLCCRAGDACNRTRDV